MAINEKDLIFDQGKANIEMQLRKLTWLVEDVKNGRTKADREAAFKAFGEAMERYYKDEVFNLKMTCEHLYGSDK